MIISVISFFLLIILVIYIFGKDLPNFDKLSYYQPRLVSKIFTSNGNFLEDYSNENRIFAGYDEIPRELKNCFLVSEDVNFYNHIGIDSKGIFRAFIKNILKTFSKKRLEGASTITQQVAKNFLLTNEISYKRKIREIILALRMENVLEKKQIMELYLNEIYLGSGSYGVRSASLNYFNKSLSDLELDEMAMLAALPKAPSTYSPYKNPIKALKRRNWVLKRLLDEKFIDVETYSLTISKPLKLSKSKKILNNKASFFKEEVRREMISMFDESKLYDGGMTIMTSLDEDIQLRAEESFRKGIKDFSRRKGWQGPLIHNEKPGTFLERINSLKSPQGLFDDLLAIVTKVKKDGVMVLLKNKKKIFLTKNRMKLIKSKDFKMKDKFKIGDILVLEFDQKDEHYNLSQIPQVNGGLVVLENNTGRVLAMVGGYDSSSSFNRSTQAKRQLGSSFKPIVYLAALDNGYTPVSKVLDAPFVIDDLSKDGIWRPTNYGEKFYGLSTLRLGIEKSRNLMTVRLSDQLGLDRIATISQGLGVYEKFPHLISSSLGSLESSLIKITSAYASIANGGIRVSPVIVDAIYDNSGNLLFKGDNRKCIDCNVGANIDINTTLINKLKIPKVVNNKKQIFTRESAYQMTSFLMGVIERGTAKNINNFNFQVAGKTGTTNDNQDAWFIGFNSEITIGVFVGYDVPKSLGKFETGSKVAAPIFHDLMKKIFKKKKTKPFVIPESIKFINIDLFTGKPSNKNYITESFKNNFSFETNQESDNKEGNFELKGFY
jgi:penicillin-binding protein 1A